MEFSPKNNPEERVAALEAKYREMDALTRGLLNELLDTKSVILKISRQAGEMSNRDVAEAVPSPERILPEGTTVIVTKSASRPEAPAAPAEPAMVRIMQADGTMKMEVRHGSTNQMDSSGGFDNTKKSSMFRNRKKP